MHALPPRKLNMKIMLVIHRRHATAKMFNGENIESYKNNYNIYTVVQYYTRFHLGGRGGAFAPLK